MNEKKQQFRQNKQLKSTENKSLSDKITNALNVNKKADFSRYEKNLDKLISNFKNRKFIFYLFILYKFVHHKKFINKN